MRKSNLTSLLLAVIIVTGALSITGIAAQEQSTLQPGVSTKGSQVGAPTNGTTVDPGNNSTIITPVDNTTIVPVGNATILPPANSTTPTPIPDNSTVPVNSTPGNITLVLENHTYYPQDTVRAYVYNAVNPAMEVIDAYGAVSDMTITRLNDSSYMGVYVLNRSIILANYTVIATDSITGITAEDVFNVTIRPPDETAENNNTTTPGNNTTATSPPYLYVNLSSSSILPGESVNITVQTNGSAPAVVIRDPVNNTAYPVLIDITNDTYYYTFYLNHSIIIGNYTVLASVRSNGAYNESTAYFNITFSRSLNKGLQLRYAAYDPVQKVIVIRANAGSALTNSTNIKKAVEDTPALKGMAVKSINLLSQKDSGNASNNVSNKVKPIYDNQSIEVVIPVDNNTIDEVADQFNITANITTATTAVTADNNTSIHVSLNNKVDGCWYRMSASIPDGYQVDKVTRADGTEITNDYEIDRSTGEVVKNDVNWYVDNGTLYFYDDPVNGYDITLQPPQANNSLAVNVINGGQLSAILYPFNQTDSDATMTSNDHLGRTQDNGYANDIDGDAGSKTAIRMYRGNQVTGSRLMMFGNDGGGRSGAHPTYSNAAYMYVNGTNSTLGFNTVPDGSVESVIITNFSTPAATGAPSTVNVTQKTIVRNNNLWFATVYYIKNVGTTNINSFGFFQGCDFNFNGQYTNDDDYYDTTNDTVYGHYNSANPNAIQAGGFSSTIHSSDYDVDVYTTIWNNIKANNLQGHTSTSGVDGGMALQWDYGTFNAGSTWMVPIIWAVGQNTTVFNNTMKYAITHNVFDVGIKSIDTPGNGESLDRSTTPTVRINATAMDVGVTDQYTTVYLQVNDSAGNIIYTNSTNVDLSVPYNETAPAYFNWSLSGVTAGTYTISVYTNMLGDQNTSNDRKTITVYIEDFSLNPDQYIHSNPGDNVNFTLNLTNLGTSTRTFDFFQNVPTIPWETDLYYNDTVNHTLVFMANDTDGNGLWNNINPSFINSSWGLPYYNVTAGGTSYFVLQVRIPAAADTGILDTVKLFAFRAADINKLNNSSVTLMTDTPLASMANKTFYFHNQFLNTTKDGTTTNKTVITSVFYLWSQKPMFADDFIISGNSTVTTWYNSTATLPITCTLFYTNGAGNTVLIGTNTSTIPASASQATPSSFTFTLPTIGGSKTVPAGYYLVAKIDNLNTTSYTVWYNSTLLSRIDVNTPTYIHVDTINIYNNGTAASVFNTGNNVSVFANVSDPIGSYDISGTNMTVNSSHGNLIITNLPMTLNMTDSGSPSLWNLYNSSFKLDASFPPDNYSVNITAIESNGVVTHKIVNFTVQSNNPAVSLYPNSTRVALNNTTVNMKHTVSNLNSGGSDTISITCTNTTTWPISFYQADGMTPLIYYSTNNSWSTDVIGPLNSTDIVIKVSVPPSASFTDVDTINIKATSAQNVSVFSMATDVIYINNTSVVKTLYLHDNGGTNATRVMNTSIVNTPNAFSSLAANGGNVSWTQTPVFARNFNILDDPSMTMYIMTNDVNANFTLTMMAVSGGTSTKLGSFNYVNNSITANTMTALNFNIPLTSYNQQLPAGSQIVVYMNNLNDQAISVYQSSQYPTHIDMDTWSYVSVINVSIFNSTGYPINSTTPPTNINVAANVTDPFGSFDISGASVSLSLGNTILIGPTAMNPNATDPSSPSLWKNFSQSLNLTGSLDTGNYSVIVTAIESNGVTSNMTAQLSISYPLNLTASKSYSPATGSNFNVTIALRNNNNHTVYSVHAYDFYASDFSVTINQSHTTTPVNNSILYGNINAFGPFTLLPNQVINITYTAQGIGNYNLSNMTIIGVDPDV